jgi:hypothetical protein
MFIPNAFNVAQNLTAFNHRTLNRFTPVTRSYEDIVEGRGTIPKTEGRRVSVRFYVSSRRPVNILQENYGRARQ